MEGLVAQLLLYGLGSQVLLGRSYDPCRPLLIRKRGARVKDRLKDRGF